MLSRIKEYEGKDLLVTNVLGGLLTVLSITGSKDTYEFIADKYELYNISPDVTKQYRKVATAEEWLKSLQYNTVENIRKVGYKEFILSIVDAKYFKVLDAAFTSFFNSSKTKADVSTMWDTINIVYHRIRIDRNTEMDVYDTCKYPAA